MRHCRGMVLWMVLMLPVMAMAQEPPPDHIDMSWQWVVYALGGLILSNIGMWLREARKHKDWKAKNGTEKEMAETVKKVNGNVDHLLIGQTELDGKIDKVNGKIDSTKDELKTEIQGVRSHCSETVKSVNSRISDNTAKIFELAKDKGA